MQARVLARCLKHARDGDMLISALKGMSAGKKYGLSNDLISRRAYSFPFRTDASNCWQNICDAYQPTVYSVNTLMFSKMTIKCGINAKQLQN
jgi:hypothetical protein